MIIIINEKNPPFFPPLLNVLNCLGDMRYFLAEDLPCPDDLRQRPQLTGGTGSCCESDCVVVAVDWRIFAESC